jgi:hypothetical protein|tara:strand:+ start:247 stop:1206 length:960 start_codon:yes stop_codon:yes gene_type:complete
MNKNLYVFLALFSILNISCVENVIFIQVYPDGQTYFKFFSVGDSTDINDKDFLHPLKNNWNGKSSFKLSKTDSIWEMTTEAIYQDSVFIFEPSNSLSFKMERSEEQRALSSFYNIKMNFIGRGIETHYPLLYKALINGSLDSLEWLPEAMTVIINLSLIDLEKDTTKNNFNINRGRLVNHFKNSFARVTTFEDLKFIQENRLDFIKNTIRPFKIGNEFAKNLAEKMKIHEEYLETSLDLKDDSFMVKILMPGEILSTNSLSMNQDTLVWRFGLDSLLNEKYLLEATSVVYSKEKIQKTSILIVSFLLILGIVLVNKQKK